MKIHYFFLIILLLLSFPVFSEDDKKDEEEEIISLNNERREVLKYGIDSELIKLLSSLKEEENKDLASDVGTVYAETLNPDIMKAAVDYFIAIDYADAVSSAEKILENWEDENFKTLSPALRYISEYPDDNAEVIISELVDHDNLTLASAALSALSKCGTEASADMLLNFLDDDEYPDELKPSIIKALGGMKSETALDTLIDILEDIDEEKSWRWNACEALGKIGHNDALPAIRNALQDKDTYLRAYAVKALGSFESEDVEDTLIQALRDSFWRVRVSAAEALGDRKSKKAVDILIYKARKDPEKNVKMAAISALGEIGDEDGLNFLNELYSKQTMLPSMRTAAVKIIIEKNLSASLDTIKTVIAEEWDKENSIVLSYTCKYLSKSEDPSLKDLFSKMLDHNDVAIKIYGIRGIQLNNFTDLKDRVESLTKEGVNNAVRKSALSAMETF